PPGGMPGSTASGTRTATASAFCALNFSNRVFQSLNADRNDRNNPECGGNSARWPAGNASGAPIYRPDPACVARVDGCADGVPWPAHHLGKPERQFFPDVQ